MIRAAIFDLWNTLIAVEPRFNPYPRIVRMLELESEAQFRKVMRAEWMTRNNVPVATFLGKLSVRLGRDITEDEQVHFERIWREYLEHVDYLPGAEQTLVALRTRGLKIAIVTNTVSHSARLVNEKGLLDLVDVFVSSADTGYLKPDPRIFQVALERLGAVASEVIVVGDKLRTDILGGLILGAKCVLYDRRFEQPVLGEPIPVTAIVPELSDLESICGALNAQP